MSKPAIRSSARAFKQAQTHGRSAALPRTSSEFGLAKYVTEIGHAAGIYPPAKQELPAMYVKGPFDCKMRVFDRHVWSPHYVEHLGEPETPIRELYIQKHLDKADQPLWVTYAAHTNKPLKGIIRSKATKRIKNAMREGLLRHGFDLHGRSVRDATKGRQLYGSINFATTTPTQIAIAPFQDVVVAFERHIPRIIQYLKQETTTRNPQRDGDSLRLKGVKGKERGERKGSLGH